MTLDHVVLVKISPTESFSLLISSETCLSGCRGTGDRFPLVQEPVRLMK